MTTIPSSQLTKDKIEILDQFGHSLDFEDDERFVVVSIDSDKEAIELRERLIQNEKLRVAIERIHESLSIL
jgi:hypothetical protein